MARKNKVFRGSRLAASTQAKLNPTTSTASVRSEDGSTSKAAGMIILVPVIFTFWFLSRRK